MPKYEMQPPVNKPNEKPPSIEGYEILGKLGQGGMSSVWKARQVSLGRIVVIKILSEQMAHDPEDIKHFKHEALIAANLKHPGIVQVHDFGQFKDGTGYYFVMEYISGYTVGDWLRRKGRLDEPDALIIAHSVADALRHAWDQAMIVHCDIKPENIMVDGDGTIKVTDLGLAQVVSTISSPAHAASDVIYVMGTPNYMSPEQVRGEKNLDCRTDIYGLGATLHHLLTGRLPFGAGAPDEIMNRQVREPYADPRELIPAISAGTANMVMKMLAKNAGERYPNWVEALVDIVKQEKASRSARPAALPQMPPTDMDRSSSTIPLQIVSDATTPQGSAQAKAPAADAGDLMSCPYCAEPIRKRAVYCRFCGKEIRKKTGSSTGVVKKTKRKLASQPQSPAPALGSLSEPLPSLKLKHHFTFWDLIRMLISLALLSFLVYYTYNKFVNKVDSMAPIRVKLMEAFQERGPIGRWLGRIGESRIQEKQSE